MIVLDKGVWGPAGWTYLHAVTLAYPDPPTDEDKANYGAFFQAVGPTLPCPDCQQNWQEHLAAGPPALESREALVRWLVDLHDRTRISQGKLPLGERLGLDAITGGLASRKKSCVVM